MAVKAKKRVSSTDSLSSLMLDRLNKSKKSMDILSLGLNTAPFTVNDVLSTGLPNLDRVICTSVDGRWGLPVGRIISVKSKPSVGKTSFLLKVCDQACKRGGAVHFVESEHALDIKYARKLSKYVDSFLISQPDTLEQAFESIQDSISMCREARGDEITGAPFIIVVDSFSGFTTDAESTKEFGTGGSMAEHARIASQACRKLTGPLHKAGAILLLSHQTKSKIGVRWGSTETNIGGDAFNYHDSVCLSFYRTAATKNKAGQITGHYGIIKTSKNKLFPPHREVKSQMINGRGFSTEFAVIDFLIEGGFVKKKAGGFFEFKHDPTLNWRGLENFSEFLKTSKKARIFARKVINDG